MRAQRYGRIINISSSAGLIGNRNNSAYSTSKAGILGLTKALSMDLGPWGITVNAIAPGAMLTSRLRSAARLATEGDERGGLGAMALHNPIGRLGTPADIAAAVTFLASEQAEYVSGQTLSVDGGMTRV